MTPAPNPTRCPSRGLFLSPEPSLAARAPSRASNSPPPPHRCTPPRSPEAASAGVAEALCACAARLPATAATTTTTTPAPLYLFVLC